MRRRKDKISITRSAAYSIGLHLALLFLSVISMFMPKREANLLVDIELAGEGEFREAMANAPSPAVPAQTVAPDRAEFEEEPKEIKEIEKTDQIEKPEEPIEHNIPEMTEGAIPEAEKDIPEERIEEKVNQEEPVSPKVEEKINEEPVPKEEKAEEVKKKEPKKEEKKPPKKRKHSKKALMEVINRAEKAKKRKDRRRKMQKLASKEEKRKRDAAFDDMLASNEKLSVKGSGLGRKGSGSGAFGSGAGISEGDYEMVSSQISRYWIVPSGVRDAENIIIEIHMELGDNGEVIPSSIQIVDKARYATDPVFRAAADSARRAILQASPLNIPREKLDLFREITWSFNVKEALKR